MAGEEDALLREVDEDVERDRLATFFQKYAKYLIGAGALLIAGVAAREYMLASATSQAERAGATYQAIIAEQSDDPADAADRLLSFAAETQSGYAGLARMRAGSLLVLVDDRARALEAFAAVYGDDRLPPRWRDLARLRAGALLVDEAPEEAIAAVTPITTPAYSAFADEIEGLAALTLEDYTSAHAIFSELRSRTDVPAVLASRAEALMPVADAGRRGVPLAPQASEAEDFINQFTEELGLDLEAAPPPPAPLPEVLPDAAPVPPGE